MITKHPKFKKMMTLLTQYDKQGYRHKYAYEASSGRTESTKELKLTEVEQIIRKLGIDFKEETDSANNQRRKIISMAREIGYEIFDKQKGKMVADMARIEDWCIKYGQFHKPLNKHTLKELPLLITQFEQRYQSFLSSL